MLKFDHVNPWCSLSSYYLYGGLSKAIINIMWDCGSVIQRSFFYYKLVFYNTNYSGYHTIETKQKNSEKCICCTIYDKLIHFANQSKPSPALMNEHGEVTRADHACLW